MGLLFLYLYLYLCSSLNYFHSIIYRQNSLLVERPYLLNFHIYQKKETIFEKSIVTQLLKARKEP